MEKKIEDYLHLYIGVKLERGGIVTHKLLAAADEAAFDAYLDFKPILRPLSSMTEEEMKEIVMLGFESKDIADMLIEKVTRRSEVQEHVRFGTAIPYTAWDKNGKVQMAGTISAHELSADQFRYLVSRSFDLFNLIPEGLALDATKQPLTQ